MSDIRSQWTNLLDALEERTRRLGLLAEGQRIMVPDVALEAPGPLPEALAPRLLALLAMTRDTEQRLEAACRRVRVAQRYAEG